MAFVPYWLSGEPHVSVGFPGGAVARMANGDLVIMSEHDEDYVYLQTTIEQLRAALDAIDPARRRP